MCAVLGVSDALNKLIDQSNRAVLSLKNGLESLKEENASFQAKNPNSSEGRIRENLHAAVTRKFREILKEYQTVQTDFKKEVREKVTRQVKIGKQNYCCEWIMNHTCCFKETVSLSNAF